MTDERFAAWVAALEARHLAALRFSEVSRALRALSATYVERRDRLARGAALDGGGKRAAFALRYGTLHYVIAREVLASVEPAGARHDTLVDLGCGTGAAGAAWAVRLGAHVRLTGVDRHQWAVKEASWTYAQFGLRGRAVQGDVVKTRLPTRRSAVVAGWIVNELDEDGRTALLARLLDARRHGASVLVLEPIARASAPWWDEWASAFVAEGGRADEWRLRVPLPDIVTKLDRAAGLSHDELTARSVWVEGRRVPSSD